ncbi:hypothetical protein GCM10020220_020910 [Nonomuraea rubra]
MPSLRVHSVYASPSAPRQPVGRMIDQPSRDCHARTAGAALVALGDGVAEGVALGVGAAVGEIAWVAAAGWVVARGVPSAGEAVLK